jgi:uncharacterized protein YjbI with pentapeptide repeats
VKQAARPSLCSFDADKQCAGRKEVDLTDAKLDDAILTNADLRLATLTRANPQMAKDLSGTRMAGAKGLTGKQVAECKAKGANFDESTSASLTTP